MVGNIPKTMLTWAFHFLGWTRYTFEHITAGYFVSTKFLDNPISLVMGFLGDYTLSGFFGVIMYLMLKTTGTDYAKLKGIAFGFFVWIVFFGILMALDVTRTSILTPLPNLLLLAPNAVFGLTTCWFIERYGGLDTRD